MFVSTGNNFGAGPISFKDVQESEYVVLNAKISCVPTSAAYQAAEQLEVYVPALSIDRSAESFATAVYTDRVPHTGYTTVFDGGTFLKTWIKDRNTIVIEKLPAFDGKADLTIYIQALFPRLNAGANTLRGTKTRLSITDPSHYTSWDQDSICSIFDKWVFLHMHLDDIYSSAEGHDLEITLGNFPTDVDAEVPILMSDNGRGNNLGGVNKSQISAGVWTQSSTERCLSFYNTGANHFVIAYLVRDGQNPTPEPEPEPSTPLQKLTIADAQMSQNAELEDFVIALAPGSVIAAVRGKVSSLSAGAVNQITLAEYPAGFVPGCDLVLARGDGENKLNFYFLNVQTNLANNQLEVSVANYGADEETDFEIFDVSSPITGF